MKMRELEHRTGVNRETIRVYFRHGLLPEPMRPKTNVADYTEDHVKAVQTIRNLQKSRRLSLEQIRRALDGDVSVANGDAAVIPHLDALVAARVGIDSRTFPLPLAEQNPHAESDAKTLAFVGAIQLHRRRGKIELSRIDLQLLSLWKAMRDAGFSEELGFSPDIVNIYVDAASSLAQKEVQQFYERLSGVTGIDSAARMGESAINLMTSFFGMLRMKAVLHELKAQAASLGQLGESQESRG